MEENSSFGFLAVGFCELAKNQMCCLCGGFHNEAQHVYITHVVYIAYPQHVHFL